jgi:hypothetical protein
VRDASEKEGGHGHRPCEEMGARDLSSVRRMQLQKSAGSILASNKLARSAPKRVAVRVNGGLGGAASGDMARKCPLPLTPRRSKRCLVTRVVPM